MTTLHGFEERVIVDTSEHEPTYLVTTGKGRYLRLSRSAFHLLRMVNSGLSMEEIARTFSRGDASAVVTEDVRAAHERLMEKVQQLDRSVEVSTFGLRYARGIISAQTVRRVSARFVAAFEMPFVVLLLIFVATAVALLARSHQPADLVAVVLPNLWSGYLLVLISLIAHEFGHAAACARFGAKPAEIGIGIYFIYPALYSDVTDAWRLTRWERVIVDCSGIFFQAIVGAAFMWIYQFTGWQAFLAASIMIVVNCLFSLNPLFKFDGYWVISDALGVTNLQADARNVASSVWRRLLRRPASELRWSRGLATTILAAGAVTAVFWTVFMIRVVPSLVTRLVAYPALLLEFVRGVGGARTGTTVGGVLNFLLATYFAVIGVRMFLGVLKRGHGYLQTTAPGLRAVVSTRRPFWLRA